jgi:DNA-binding response OmpR family regulator
LQRVLHAAGGAGQVLVVEQDEEIAGALVTSLNGSGVRAAHVGTLQQAVDRCMMGAPDLLVLDTALPDGDGLSLVDWMRHQPVLSTLPLIVYSGRTLSESEMQRLRAGPAQILDKARVRPKQVADLVLMLVQHRPDTAAVA